MTTRHGAAPEQRSPLWPIGDPQSLALPRELALDCAARMFASELASRDANGGPAASTAHSPSKALFRCEPGEPAAPRAPTPAASVGSVQAEARSAATAPAAATAVPAAAAAPARHAEQRDKRPSRRHAPDAGALRTLRLVDRATRDAADGLITRLKLSTRHAADLGAAAPRMRNLRALEFTVASEGPSAGGATAELAAALPRLPQLTALTVKDWGNLARGDRCGHGWATSSLLHSSHSP